MTTLRDTIAQAIDSCGSSMQGMPIYEPRCTEMADAVLAAIGPIHEGSMFLPELHHRPATVFPASAIPLGDTWKRVGVFVLPEDEAG